MRRHRVSRTVRFARAPSYEVAQNGTKWHSFSPIILPASYSRHQAGLAQSRRLAHNSRRHPKLGGRSTMRTLLHRRNPHRQPRGHHAAGAQDAGRGGPYRGGGHSRHAQTARPLRRRHASRQLPRAQRAGPAAGRAGRAARGDVALVSDAGMPSVNDPGQELAREAAAGRRVRRGGAGPIGGDRRRGRGRDRRAPTWDAPGISAATSRGPQAAARLTGATSVAPRGLRDAAPAAGRLQDALDTLGDRRAAVCRELTKLHERRPGTLLRGAGSLRSATRRVHAGHRRRSGMRRGRRRARGRGAGACWPGLRAEGAKRAGRHDARRGGVRGQPQRRLQNVLESGQDDKRL